MVRFVRLLLALLAVLVIMFLAINNRQPVEVSFWPLPFATTAPVYAVFLAGLVIGMLIGGLALWFRALANGREARRQRNRAWALENQLNIIRQQQERAAAERPAPAAPSPGTALAPARVVPSPLQVPARTTA